MAAMPMSTARIPISAAAPNAPSSALKEFAAFSSWLLKMIARNDIKIVAAAIANDITADI